MTRLWYEVTWFARYRNPAALGCMHFGPDHGYWLDGAPWPVVWAVLFAAAVVLAGAS